MLDRCECVCVCACTGGGGGVRVCMCILLLYVCVCAWSWLGMDKTSGCIQFHWKIGGTSDVHITVEGVASAPAGTWPGFRSWPSAGPEFTEVVLGTQLSAGGV